MTYKPTPLEEATSREDLYALALWHVYGILGFDTDGDIDPGAVIAGMGPLGFAQFVVGAAHEHYEQYEDATYDLAGEDA